MDSDLGELLSVLLMVAFVFVAVFLLGAWAGAVGCRHRWEPSGRRTEYHVLGGCLVEDAGRMVPEDYLRRVEIAP